MRLILIRHASAQERESFAQVASDDSLRPLTESGQKKMERLAKKYFEFGYRPELIITSPYKRAVQTAEILKQFFTYCPLIQAEELKPECEPNQFANWLSLNVRGMKCVMAIGHEPNLSLLASWLLVGTQTHPIISFKKGGAACLELDSFRGVKADSARLIWLVRPKLFL